jgi:hypothetical protein
MKTSLVQTQFPVSMTRWAAGIAVTLSLLSCPQPAHARPAIRSAFFTMYTNAVGSKLDTVPSHAGHCGVCHYDFSGSGPKNPYGNALVSSGFTLTKEPGISSAIAFAATNDWEGDGFISRIEITNTAYANTPTFPGLQSSNVNSVLNVSVSDIIGYITPTTGSDTTPPSVLVFSPTNGQTLVANRFTNITWSASDASGVAAINIYLSLNNGATYQQIARNLTNSGTYSWVPADRPATNAARIKVVATDTYGNSSNSVSAAFTIISGPFTNSHGVATTLRDFDMPGTQPFEHGPDLDTSPSCASCHGGYSQAVEPYFNWRGAMMANASRDLLFQANMAIANQDAANSGDLCLRCHLNRGWLAGRSVPTDGSRMVAEDTDGITCALCHRMANPFYTAGVSPTNDVPVLAALSFPGTNYGNGMFVIDPTGLRRGPYTNAALGHDSLGSPFHRSAAFCGTCHDVSNPAFTKDGQGIYQPNTFNAPASNFSPHFIAPVERTYSEWLNSTYAASNGVYAPQFAGNRPDGRVATCQHCHMSYASGYAADTNTNPGIPIRGDMAVHDQTGGSTWMMSMLTNLFPAEVSRPAINASVARSVRILTNAASLAVGDAPNQLKVTVTNECGHKLPTGYPEGRRVWVNVKFYSEASSLLGESAAYNPATGVLSRDAEAKIYEVHPGIDTNINGLLGFPAEPTLHFVLNNKIYEDNRIPPRGFTNAAFAPFGGAPVGHAYADGQYWDDSLYALPAGAVRAEVKLYYQSTSKEFVEFLRDENRTTSHGQAIYNLWATNGMCPPTLMAQTTWVTAFGMKTAKFVSGGKFRMEFLSRPGLNYTIEFRDSLTTGTWQTFVANGTFTASDTTSAFEDDFTTASSGGPSATGQRYYRFKYSAP